MNKGDWIQLLMIIAVFTFLGLLIYSIINFPAWVTGLIVVLYFIGYRIIAARIKL
ncbi:MAG: hypothetical protein ACHQFW_08665 [Chitinophagales bacterium]